MKKTKKVNKKKSTKKVWFGGESLTAEKQQQKNTFRKMLNYKMNDLIDKIVKKTTSRNKIKECIQAIINLFRNNIMINTLIPVSSSGKYIDKETNKESIVDFVSPVIFLLDNLTGILEEKDIIRILNSYYSNGGNFNSLSSRYKISPFKNELNKRRINNVRMLLNKSNNFHIIEDGLDEQTKIQLAELIPNEQQIRTVVETDVPQQIVEPERIKLQLPYPLPENNDVGYNREVVPEFWKPIFQNGEELLQFRNDFMGFYESDRYVDDNRKIIEICQLLETIIPGYMTRYTLIYPEIPKTLVNVNIMNCFITILYSLILYRLYETRQDFLFIFKGGRALQLSLVDIPDIGKYFSEDTDILIIPNKFEGVRTNYDFEKMENLSEHIAYLVKWFIPEDVNVLVSLPTNPKNTNKDITKVLYNDGKLFKAVSDIGFGEINEDIKKYFDTLVFSPVYINKFETNILFITPTIDDMLAEKLFYYAKYLKLKHKLIKNEPISEIKYRNITLQECEFILPKFKRSIIKLIEGIMKKKYTGSEDFNEMENSQLILRGIISEFNDYSINEKNAIISYLLQGYFGNKQLVDSNNNPISLDALFEN